MTDDFDNGKKLDYNAIQIFVKRHHIKEDEIYQVVFSDKRKPLVITKTISFQQVEFWTSLPQGRIKEAMDIGKIIDRITKQ